MPPRRLALLAALALSVRGHPADAQQELADQQLVSVLQQSIPHIMRLIGTPGLNLAVARHGDVIWEAGFGFADLERKIPMTAATVFHSGSMGKTYTATAVMQLVERNVLELDAPINRYLTGFQIRNPLGGREVTIRDLLTHRSGLAGNAAHSVLRSPTALAAHIPLAYAESHVDFYNGATVPIWATRPGETYEYSNLGIATLGYLVEVTNPERLSFSDYVQRRVIEPLGMRSTQYPPVQDSAHVRPDIWARMSTGYSAIGAIRIPTPAIYFEDHPAGTVVSTPGDHIRLLLAMQHDGRYNGRQVLEPATVRSMLTPQARIATNASIGLVWRLQDWDTPARSFSHSGAHMWGWTNVAVDFPELDLAVAVSMNGWSLPDDATARYREGNLIVDMARSLVERQRTGPITPVTPHSWAWKVSYVAGLTMVERINGVLGISDPITAAMVDAMVRGSVVQSQLERGESVWDPAGFRAGIRDMTAVEMRPAAIAHFMRSDRLQIMPEELPIIYLELGGRGTLPPTR